jgi:putative transposase
MQRRAIVKEESLLSISAQCRALEVSRSGFYYNPCQESELNLELMRLIDEHYLLYPFYGVPRMYDWLKLDKGYDINYKRVERLMRLMGLSAVGPNPNTSKRHPQHPVFPYLLRGLKILYRNQVWAVDITYLPMARGFMYLFAIIDLFSRYVVGWDISNNMEAEWCADVLQQAREEHGDPEILNSDQGSQFTSDIWIKGCEGIRLSMDGKGRAIDNIFIERLWRSVKYEHVYLRPASDGLELFEGLQTYFEFYNKQRRHQSLESMTPASVYHETA